MDKMIKLLGGLLAAQVLLAIWAFSGGPDLSVLPPDEPLLTVDPAEINEIRVEGPEGAGVTLNREGEGWILSNAWKVPAKDSKVKSLIDRLQELKTGLAVATTSGAKERFEVADDKFERRITLVKGDETLATLYLGTSPGLRKIHARRSGDDLVYSISFAAYEAPDKADDWLDAGLLHFKQSELETIEFDGLALAKTKISEKDESNAGWRADGLATGERVNEGKVQDLARLLSQLDVRKVLGTEANPEYQQDAPALELRLRRSGTEPVTWTLTKPEQDDDYILKSSQHPWYFGVASWTAKPLLEVAKRDALVVSPEQPVMEQSDENGTPGMTESAENTGAKPEEATTQSPSTE